MKQRVVTLKESGDAKGSAWTLRRRLLGFAISEIAALGILFLAVWIFIRVSVIPRLERTLRAKTADTALALASELNVAFTIWDTAAMTNHTQRLLSDRDFRALELADAKSANVFSIGDGSASAIRRQGAAGVVSLRDGILSTWVSVQFEGVELGTIAVAFDTAEIRVLSQASAGLGVAALLAVVAAVLFAVRFSRRFLRPIVTMMEFSRRVAAGHLADRLARKGDGEILALIDHLNTMAEAIGSRQAALEQRRAELEASLGQLRATQDELLQSTRLASVGEMAGRTAHEVLNPITSVQGRLTRLLEENSKVGAQNLATLSAIIGAWRAAFDQGGVDGLAASLKVEVVGPGDRLRPVCAEDLENIEGITRHIDEQGARTRADFEFLMSQVDRVTRIIDGMRGLTRGRSTIGPAILASVVGQAMEIGSDSALKRGIKMVNGVSPDIMVVVDPNELTQILSNLLRNGMQAIEERCGRSGGGITFSAEVVGAAVRLRVHDTGTGIKPEHMPLIFESGFTTRSATDGTGLGLSISRRLARRLGGDLSVEETQPGTGTTFLLELRHLPDASAAPASVSVRMVALPEGLPASAP